MGARRASGRVRAPRARGFTLIELMVVVAVIAIGTAVAGLALRDASGTALEREGERLAALFEAARAQSRASGVPVRWHAVSGGFIFEGLPSTAPALPQRWLDEATAVLGQPLILLGPDPVIGAQRVVLQRADGSGLPLTIATDGLRPFAVAGGAP